MDGVNKVILLGNLGQDAELKYTQARNEPVLDFHLACSRSFDNAQGQRQEKTEWVSCVLWGKRGAALAPYLTKGTRLFVEGELYTQSYEKNGEKKFKTRVRVMNVVFGGASRPSGEAAPRAGTKSNGNGKDQAPRAAAGSGGLPIAGDSSPNAHSFGEAGHDDDEIPF